MKELMSSSALKKLRKSIGANRSRMAELLGLSNTDSLRKMENGKESIAHSVQRIARYMQQGPAGGSMSLTLPEFMICSDIKNDIKFDWIIHTRYPRFLAVALEKPVDDLLCVTMDGIESLCVTMWMDEPVRDPTSLVEEAARYFTIFQKSL